MPIPEVLYLIHSYNMSTLHAVISRTCARIRQVQLTAVIELHFTDEVR